jgi:FkbM family methyltransferase
MKSPIASLRKRLVRLRSFPQLGKRDGYNFILDPQNWIDNRMLAQVPYETQQLAFAKQLVGKHHVTTFIDVGANFGLYSIILGGMSEIQRVIAFEPVRRNFNQLCGNIFANKLDEKIQVHCCALGMQNGRATIHIDPTSTGISRLNISSTSRDTRVFKEQEDIEICRGDDLILSSVEHVFMKIDVEGQALEVLQGLNIFLQSRRGVLQVELDEDEASVIAFLADRGWAKTHRIQGDTYFQKLDADTAVQTPES